MSIEELTELRDELRALDIGVAQRIRDLEEEYRSWELGIPIALGTNYVFAKLNNKWRFLRVDGRPVTDLHRTTRAAFLAEWGIKHNFEMAAELALRAAIDERKGALE